jgi:hypothetical protein
MLFYEDLAVTDAICDHLKPYRRGDLKHTIFRVSLPQAVILPRPRPPQRSNPCVFTNSSPQGRGLADIRAGETLTRDPSDLTGHPHRLGVSRHQHLDRRLFHLP